MLRRLLRKPPASASDIPARRPRTTSFSESLSIPNWMSEFLVLRSWRKYSATTSGPKLAFSSSALFLSAKMTVAKSSASMGALRKRLPIKDGGTLSRTYLANTLGCLFMELKCRNNSKLFFGLWAGTLGVASVGTAAPRRGIRDAPACDEGEGGPELGGDAAVGAAAVGAAAAAGWLPPLAATGAGTSWRSLSRIAVSCGSGCKRNAASTSSNAAAALPSSCRAMARR
mmetsp:Transcript_45180/g.96498  ORF Transcript_45180/g.96498 Transcript_45180/m.96498 type:complete len:228 (-) Transcript_45180:1141-1824(-)